MCHYIYKPQKGCQISPAPGVRQCRAIKYYIYKINFNLYVKKRIKYKIIQIFHLLPQVLTIIVMNCLKESVEPANELNFDAKKKFLSVEN